MRLVNKNTHNPLVEFNEDKIIFHNKFLEQEMKHVGIAIPNGLRGVFHGRDYIFLGDLDFPKAFREVYFIVSMNPETFLWEE